LAWFVLFHFMLHWFIITEHDCYCFIWCVTGSSLLGMAFIVSLPSSLTHHYWACLVMFHFMLPCFFLTGHGLYCFSSWFSRSVLLGMACIVSFHASLVHHYWARFVLFHFMLHWFLIPWHGFALFHFHYWLIITVRGLYFFAACFNV
jgi:hypothetical protein